MKVVFIEDVPSVARAGDTRVVADGYARNYLIPKKLAVLANSASSNIVQAQMKKVAQKRALEEAEMAGVAAKVNGMEFTIKAKVGEKDRLYGSVTSADIAEEVSRTAGLDIDKRKIELEEPIREVGVHDINIRFTHDITAAIKLTVEPEVVVEEKEEKKEEKKRKPRAEKKEAEVETEAEAVTETEETAEDTESGE